MNHFNQNCPHETYQINEDLLFENEFAGETYVSAHLQRLQHGIYTDPNLHTKHTIYVNFAAITFVMHSSRSLDHRFESAIITIKAKSANDEPLRFLKFVPHQAYGRISSESLKWNFQLGTQIGVNQGPATATVNPGMDFEKDKVIGTMMKIQGSTRSTFTSSHALEKKFRHPDTLLHWSLEENSQQEAGIPREFTFVFFMERPRLRPHASAHRKSYSLPLSQPSSHVESQTKREKFGHEMFARLKQAKEEVKDGVRMMVEVIKDEAKPMKYSDPSGNGPLKGGERLEEGFEEIFTPIKFEICVDPKISGILESHLTTPIIETSTVAGEVGQRFLSTENEYRVGKEDQPVDTLHGWYNFAKMSEPFEHMVCLPGVSVGSRMPSLDDAGKEDGK